VKLLLYSHSFVPSVGGVETIVLSLARGLAGLRDSNGAPRFEITLVTKTPAGNYEDGAHPFRVIRKPGFRQLWRLIRESDVIHVAGPALAPMTLSLMARKPFVIEHHGLQTICPNGQLLIEPAARPCPGHFMSERQTECLRCNSGRGWPISYKLWLLTFVRRFLCARAAANVAPTEWLGRLLELPRVVTIHHGLEVPESVSPPKSGPGNPAIVFVGRLVTTKGVPVLMEATRLLSGEGYEVRVAVIGDGPERAALEQLARDSQIAERVQFTGRIAGAQFEAVLAKASAVVVPSLGGEVFGLVVAENMLRGLAVVVSDIGPLAEVLGDSGLTFRTGDAEDLSSVLARLLDHPSLAAALGYRARQRALLFYSLDRMIHSHTLLYSQLRSLKNL
jgi:glycogen synthase